MTTTPRVPDVPHDEQRHLIVLDPTSTQVLVHATPRVWLLPAVRTRAGDVTPPALAAAQRLASLGIPATPIHEAPLSGTLALPDGLREIRHHYSLFEAVPAARRLSHFLWIPAAELLGERRALHPAQRPALREALVRAVLRPDARFDAPAGLHELFAWAQVRLAARGARMTGLPMPRRMRRWEALLDIPTTAGPMLLEAGPGQTSRAALLLGELHALCPRHFPRILADDATRQCWLLSPARGEGTVACGDRGDEAVWLRTVTALAEVQRQALQSADVRDLVRARAFGPVQLDQAIVRLRELIAGGSARVSWPEPRLARLERVLRGAVYRLFGHELPWTWTPAAFRLSDLRFATPGASTPGARVVQFDGAEEGYYAPPTFALSSFVDDLRVRGRVTEDVLARLREAYVDAWRGVLPAARLRQAIADTQIPGLLFDFWVHLDRRFRWDRVSPLETAADAVDPALAEYAHQLATRIPDALPPSAAAADGAGDTLREWRIADWGTRSSS